jgi:hypothetical protein
MGRDRDQAGRAAACRRRPADLKGTNKNPGQDEQDPECNHRPPAPQLANGFHPERQGPARAIARRAGAGRFRGSGAGRSLRTGAHGHPPARCRARITGFRQVGARGAGDEGEEGILQAAVRRHAFHRDPGPDQRGDHRGRGDSVRAHEDPVRMPLGAVDPVHPGQHGDCPLRLRGADDQRRSRADDLADRAGRQPPAHAHHDHVRAGLLHLSEHVAGQDHRPAVRRVLDQDIAHLPDLRRVEAVHRLVEHQQVRQAEHGLGNGEPLAHPARVRPHRAVDGRAQPGDRDHPRQVRSPAGRPVARQYRSRLARPDKCGRKPGPSTNEPSRDSAGAPGRTGRPKIMIVPRPDESGPSGSAAWWSSPRRWARAARGSGRVPPAGTARRPRAGRRGSAWSGR